MQRLWSAWRSEYVQAESASAGCIFCAFPSQADDARNLIAHRGEHAFVILNRFPYNPGHLMVVPYQHVAVLPDLAPKAAAEVMHLLQRSTAVLDAVYAPGGYNVGMNLGTAAGAGIADHLHLHVVPRWIGDTNFMPTIAETKVVPELLGKTYDKLRAAFEGDETER